MISYEDKVISELGTEECSPILLSKILSKNEDSLNFYDFKTEIGEPMQCMELKKLKKLYPGIPKLLLIDIKSGEMMN